MKSCLAVDDSRVAREVARHMLEKLGLDVDEARDGEEALERCAAHMPDLILLDCEMPGMGGIEFLRELDRKGPRPVVILCTANDEPDAPADFYLAKPFDFKALEAAVRSLGFGGEA